MADWNDPATWDLSDKIRDGRPLLWDGSPNPTFGSFLNYLSGRSFARAIGFDASDELAFWFNRLAKVSQIPNITPAAETLVVGCGFGWFMEVIIDAGGNRVWGTDTSTLIHEGMVAAGVRADVQPLILNIDFTDADAVKLFRSARAGGTGNNRGKFDWIVTEHLLEDWPIGDIQNALDACENLRSNNPGGIAHVVTAQDRITPGSSNPIIIANQLNLAEWIALRDSHWWVDTVSGTLGGGI